MCLKQLLYAVTLQPIRVQSGPHQETAVLHVIETEASTAELRGSAMHHRSSKHSLLFSSKGKLLHANKAAMDAYQQGSGDSMHIFLWYNLLFTVNLCVERQLLIS